MNYSVVIVTYNRCELLKECIQAVLNQSMEPYHVYIVNNASTDGTKEYLDQQKDPRLIIKNMETNLGGSGGFHEGLSMVKDSDTDWCIIIDDDAMLHHDFFEQIARQMKEDESHNRQVYAYAGAVTTNGVIQTEHRQFAKRPGFQLRRTEQQLYEQSSFCCDVASFCGLVIHHSVLDRIGLPEKDYFIWFDDTEYSLRIRTISDIVVVPTAVLNHKVVVTEQEYPRHYTWKDYYGLRNRVYMVRKHGNWTDRVWLRVYQMINYQFRNWLFQLTHKNGQDWKYEKKIYHMAMKDAYVNHKKGKNPDL